MKRIISTTLLALIFSHGAFAQGPRPTIDPRQAPSQQQPPGERALLQKLNVEINNTLQCATSGFALQDQLSAAQAHIKALEEKYEAKTQPTDDPKKPDE